MKLKSVLASGLLALVGSGFATAAPPAPRPWMDTSLSADTRAGLLLAQLTQEEKLRLVRSDYAVPGGPRNAKVPSGALGSAAFVPANPRLGLPALQISDAGLGVANPNQARPGDTATAMPSTLASAASFDPALAFAGGAMIGQEASRKGLNVLLAGGIDLVRDPRNGRNFEYAGEDPLLAGRIVGAAIDGIQSQHVLSTIKHYALNDQETGRTTVSAQLGEQAMRQSDLLAFELAIERGRPGAVMCSYNKINGSYACENDYLLNQVLKRDWAYPGFVMSDWGGTHSAGKAANAGLDQESAGDNFDDQVYFDQPLRQALAAGEVSQARLDDMVRRILRSMFAVGLFDHPVRRQPIDRQADLAVARTTLENGAVLLRNQQALLPLRTDTASIAVIGAHADRGVLAGGGSSLVQPAGGSAVSGLQPTDWPGPVVYDPSAPLQAIRRLAGKARVDYAQGNDVAAAAALARQAQVAVVFVQKWSAESVDAADLSLPDGQDALIAAVARANPHTVVVLETNGPVAMPWLDQVGAVLEAWYPGNAGGEAIGNLLFGQVDPSGRLPLSWPRDVSQLPRATIPGAAGGTAASTVDYTIEGADVGYRWYQRRNQTPLFAFGFGLSYTRFGHTAASVKSDARGVHVDLHVSNRGTRAGAEVVQVYVSTPAVATRRLAGFAKVELAPGASTSLRIPLEARLLSDFDTGSQRWKRPGSRYLVYVGRSATDLDAPLSIDLPPSE